MNVLADNIKCIAITIVGLMSEQYKANHGANCWLKGNGTRTSFTDTMTSAHLCTTPDCTVLVENADP